MRIFSWNVNGLRAAVKKGFFEWLKSEAPDVVCLQEIKAQTQDLDAVSYTHLTLPTKA